MNRSGSRPAHYCCHWPRTVVHRWSRRTRHPGSGVGRDALPRTGGRVVGFGVSGVSPVGISVRGHNPASDQPSYGGGLLSKQRHLLRPGVGRGIIAFDVVDVGDGSVWSSISPTSTLPKECSTVDRYPLDLCMGRCGSSELDILLCRRPDGPLTNTGELRHGVQPTASRP